MPTENDLLILVSKLEELGVQYMLIGGSAMLVHGFPRATKDIDLLLPVEAKNNERLLMALKELPGNQNPENQINKEKIDLGHSTRFEGHVSIDLLYVAADYKFDDLLPHLRVFERSGVSFKGLDLDGMLKSKDTTRESDHADRMKLQRLKSLQNEKATRTLRMQNLLETVDKDPALQAYAQAAVMHGIGFENAESIPTKDWKLVDFQAAEQLLKGGLTADEVAEKISGISPSILFESQRRVFKEAVEKLSSKLSENNDVESKPDMPSPT